jgi:hypothetical protein
VLEEESYGQTAAGFFYVTKNAKCCFYVIFVGVTHALPLRCPAARFA